MWDEERRQREERRRKEMEEWLRQAEQMRREAEEQMRSEREKLKNWEEQRRKHQEDLRRSIDRAWAAYEAQHLLPPSQLEFHTILWPVLTPPSRVPSKTTGAPPIIRGLSRRALREFVLSPTHSVDMSARARIQVALLRWHPDKMGRVMERVVEKDREAVEEGVKLVVGELAVLLREVSEARKT